mmetsp:Transcript_18883/g.40720  ORF Transcript_18883/g.40720 Transcript_18883/m.40720 type:complete len:99 (+) Transcript_18883:537-833(+)|eukprot:3099912-Pleurochrysis_carterae.AAC.1
MNLKGQLRRTNEDTAAVPLELDTLERTAAICAAFRGILRGICSTVLLTVLFAATFAPSGVLFQRSPLVACPEIVDSHIVGEVELLVECVADLLERLDL